MMPTTSGRTTGLDSQLAKQQPHALVLIQVKSNSSQCDTVKGSRASCLPVTGSSNAAPDADVGTVCRVLLRKVDCIAWQPAAIRANLRRPLVALFLPHDALLEIQASHTRNGRLSGHAPHLSEGKSGLSCTEARSACK